MENTKIDVVKMGQYVHITTQLKPKKISIASKFGLIKHTATIIENESPMDTDMSQRELNGGKDMMEIVVGNNQVGNHVQHTSKVDVQHDIGDHHVVQSIVVINAGKNQKSRF